MYAAAKLLQSCLTLCDPIDDSPPGSPVPGILQARTLEWVAISFSNAWKWKVRVKSLSCARLLVTPWTAAHQAPPSCQASLSITNSQSLLKLMSIELVMPCNYLILCCSLPLLPQSSTVWGSFQWVGIRWPKYWSFSFNISPSNKYSGLFSFRMDWFDLLAVQGTLKSLLQHHSSKASILQCSSSEFSSFLSIRKHLITLSLYFPKYKIKLRYLSCRANVVILFVKGLANGKCSKWLQICHYS